MVIENKISRNKEKTGETLMNLSREPRILLVDIETSPMIAYSWGPKWETNLIEILEESQILSYSAKWLNGKHITRGQIDTKGYKPHELNDKELVIEINNLLNESDIVVSQNGNDFDIKMIKSRCILYGLNPPNPFKTIDTMVEAKKCVRLPSYKMDDLCSYFGLGSKIPTTFNLWKDCMKGDKKAWRLMKSYNQNDVILLEKLYLKLKPYMKTHPNYGVYLEDEVCPRCGSKDLQRRGYARTLACVYQRLQCKNCGSWSRSRKNEEKHSILMNVS